MTIDITDNGARRAGGYRPARSPFAVRRSPPGRRGSRGFTLIEMVVSVALFAVVMVICLDVMLALSNANRKAQALQSVMNNLNIALDGMARAIREGSNFNGSVDCSGNTTSAPNDCTDGSTEFSFEPYGNTGSGSPTVYAYDPDGSVCGQAKSICRSEGGGPLVPITAPEVSIEQLEFYVIGTTPGDTIQPKVIIVAKGSAGLAGTSAETTFHIQTTAVQRVLDL